MSFCLKATFTNIGYFFYTFHRHRHGPAPNTSHQRIAGVLTPGSDFLPHGAPDLVVEILSPGNSNRKCARKPVNQDRGLLPTTRMGLFYLIDQRVREKSRRSTPIPTILSPPKNQAHPINQTNHSSNEKAGSSLFLPA